MPSLMPVYALMLLGTGTFQAFASSDAAPNAELRAEKEIAGESAGGAGSDSAQNSRDAGDWTVAIYPVLAWLQYSERVSAFPACRPYPEAEGMVAVRR
jgi:hypothetical protein